MQEVWKPFPRQEFALSIPPSVFEILFGGARGPGKTEAGIVWLTGDELPNGKLYITHPRYRALVLRKNYDDLVDWIDKAAYLYKRYGAEIIGKPAVIRWPSGAKFRLGHLKDRTSYEKYLGHGYHRILVEELTQISQEIQYIKILGSCRSTINELRPQIFNTANPGGKGHAWVKKRFVDPSPPNIPFMGSDGRRRIYVPATVEDNPVLVTKDPGYIQYLDGLKETDYELWKAWRLGDWDTFAGQFFREFRKDLHVPKRPFEPEINLPRFAGIDWGYEPGFFVFLAAALQKVEYDEVKFNRLWVFSEIDGQRKDPQEWAEEIKTMWDLENFSWIRGDPSMFIKQADGSRSIADQFIEQDISVIPANNDRINGWMAVRNWLSIAPDGIPYLIISPFCHNLIRTLPELVHDENHIEDLDNEGADHWADALRYMVIHVKWIDAQLGLAKRPAAKKKIPQPAHLVDLSKFAKAKK